MISIVSWLILGNATWTAFPHCSREFRGPRSMRSSFPVLFALLNLMQVLLPFGSCSAASTQLRCGFDAAWASFSGLARSGRGFFPGFLCQATRTRESIENQSLYDGKVLISNRVLVRVLVALKRRKRFFFFKTQQEPEQAPGKK